MLRSIYSNKLIVIVKETARNSVIYHETRTTLISSCSTRRSTYADSESDTNYCTSSLGDVCVPKHTVETFETSNIYENLESPWPIKSNIYGDEGWRSYGRLITPKIELSSLILSSKETVKNLQDFTRTAYKLISEVSSFNNSFICKVNPVFLKAFSYISQSKYMNDHVYQNTKNGMTLAFNRGKLKTAIIMNKFKEITPVFIERGKEITPIIVNMGKEITPAIINKTKEISPILINKGKQITNYFLDKREEIKKKIQGNENVLSHIFLEQNKNLNMTIGIRNNMHLMLLKSKYLEDKAKIITSMQNNEIAKTLSIKSKENGNKLSDTHFYGLYNNTKYYFNHMLDSISKGDMKQNYSYVDRFFNRVEPKPQNISLIKTESISFNKTPKQEYHWSASQMTKINKPINFPVSDYPYYLIGIFSTHKDSPSQSKVTRLPVKNVWHGLRDKTLPSLQETISSVLEKVQNSINSREKKSK